MSTPATPELLNGWCGPVLVDTDDDLDALVLGVHLGEPLSPRGAMVWHDDGGVGSQRHPVEQIYLDADIPEVRDRLARALAQRYGLECGATAPMWRPWNNHPELLTWNLHNSRVGIAFDPAEVSVLSCPVVRVPTLATIPADAPPMLRAARALVLCWEAALHSGA